MSSDKRMTLEALSHQCLASFTTPLSVWALWSLHGWQQFVPRRRPHLSLFVHFLYLFSFGEGFQVLYVNLYIKTYRVPERSSVVFYLRIRMFLCRRTVGSRRFQDIAPESVFGCHLLSAMSKRSIGLTSDAKKKRKGGGVHSFFK